MARSVREIVQSGTDALTAHARGRCALVLAENVTLRPPGGIHATGRGTPGVLREWFTAVPDTHVEVHIPDGAAVAEGTSTGTHHEGLYGHVPPTGHSATAECIQILRFRESRHA